MSKRPQNDEDRLSDRHGKSACPVNGMLLHDALFGLLILTILCMLAFQAVFVYEKSTHYSIEAIETQWFYDDGSTACLDDHSHMYGDRHDLLADRSKTVDKS